MRLTARVLIVPTFFLLTIELPAASEIVIAIRYLQTEGTSHSHLYLYREDGKILRQLTTDNSGQDVDPVRSEEHTSELQSPMYLVCRLLLEKKKQKNH